MRTILKPTVIAVSMMAAFASSQVVATNGLAPTGLGQVHKAMGGAAVGNPENTTTIMSNPAAASFVDDGYDIGAEIFKPIRTVTNNTPFTTDATSHPFNAQGQAVNPPPYTTLNPQGGSIVPGTSYSGDKLSAFFIPEFGYKKSRGAYDMAIVGYGNGGMNTSFANSPAFAADALSAGGNPILDNTGQPTGALPDHVPDSVFNFNSTSTGPKGTTGVDLKQLFVSPTISKKVNTNNSVGLSINLVAQQFQATGLSALAGGSVDGANFTDRGKSNSTGIGATLGWMGKFGDNTFVGASYRLKTNMSKFKKYKGLFPNGGEMDVPAALTIGMSTNVAANTRIAVDLERIYYSKVDAIGNPFAPSGFGGANGPGFGWTDQNIFKIGVKQKVSPTLSLMAGYNHGKSPVGPEDTFFNALTPAVVEDHLSLGLEYKLSDSSKLIGSYIRTFENEVKGDVALGQQFDIKMDQHALGIAYSKTF